MKIKLDKFYIHEALDRIYCIQEMVETLLLGHPVAVQNLEVSKHLMKAQKHLSKAYQLIGGIRRDQT